MNLIKKCFFSKGPQGCIYNTRVLAHNFPSHLQLNFGEVQFHKRFTATKTEIEEMTHKSNNWITAQKSGGKEKNKSHLSQERFT